MTHQAQEKLRKGKDEDAPDYKRYDRSSWRSPGRKGGGDKPDKTGDQLPTKASHEYRSNIPLRVGYLHRNLRFVQVAFTRSAF